MLNFFVPKKTQKVTTSKGATFAAVIPSYRPTDTTYQLIRNLLEWYPTAQIVLIDDCTPLTSGNSITINKIKNLAKVSKNLTYLRTPVNALKAGALNYGINYLLSQKKRPEIIFTSDDDIRITKDTLHVMVKELKADPLIGAVCSLALVKNKNHNLLTRLQSLEYHGYNITRTADNGFLKGPLVMHGMLTAFRSKVLKKINGFTERHLIEDYDITVRMKNAGYDSKLALDAEAWTEVPETIEGLWKQRVRWSYGGLGVMAQYWRNTSAIFQDLLGHIIFLTLTTLIMLSLFVNDSYDVNSVIIFAVVGIAVINFIFAYSINLITMFNYRKRDKIDWVLRASIIPELIYCNVLTLILLGSYLFFAYNSGLHYLAKKVGFMFKPYNAGLTAFSKVGYSSTWGTKA